MAKINKLLIRLKNLKPFGFWSGLTIGVLYFGYIFFWLWNLYPLHGFGITSGLISFAVIFVLFSVGVAGMAVFWGLFSYLAFSFFKDKKQPISAPLYLAGTFVLGEYLRSFFFGILWLGNGSYLGPHWTIGNLAYLFSDMATIIRTSSVWGIYGIEFIMTYFFSGLIYYSQKRAYRKVILYLMVPAIIILVAFSTLPQQHIQDTEKIPVAIIQTRIPSRVFYEQEETLTDFKNKLELIKKSSTFLDSFQNKGLVILPEGANLLTNLNSFLNPEDVKNYFNKLSKNELLIVDQFRLPEGEGLKSKTAVIGSKSGLVATYDKRLLTPTGEFLPYILKLPLLAASRLANFDMPIDFYAGSGSNVFEFEDKKITLAVCSELLSPSLIGENNPDLIIAIHNFGLFNGGRLLEKQIVAMSQFRAAENGKYSATSSNYGQSYIINPFGKIEKKALTTDYELLTGEIAPNKSQTWYNYLGDWPILLLSSAIFAVGTKKIRNEFQG